MKTMYKAQNGSPATTLSAALGVDDVSVTVVDGSILPDAPVLLTIGVDSDCEVVLCTEKNGNLLTVERGFYGTVPAAWEAGIAIYRAYTAYDHDTFIENLQGCVEADQGADNAGKIMVIGEDGKLALADIQSLLTDAAEVSF